MIDTEELQVQLKEQGITMEIYPTDGRFLVSLTNLSDNTPIGIAVTNTVEQSLATLMRRLADTKINQTNNTTNFEGLSRL